MATAISLTSPAKTSSACSPAKLCMAVSFGWYDGISPYQPCLSQLSGKNNGSGRIYYMRNS